MFSNNPFSIDYNNSFTNFNNFYSNKFFIITFNKFFSILREYTLSLKKYLILFLPMLKNIHCLPKIQTHRIFLKLNQISPLSLTNMVQRMKEGSEFWQEKIKRINDGPHYDVRPWVVDLKIGPTPPRNLVLSGSPSTSHPTT